jgi:hypothetical protein
MCCHALMTTQKIVSRFLKILTTAVVTGVSVAGQAFADDGPRSISSSGIQARYTYEATFRSLARVPGDQVSALEVSAVAEAQFHASHVFGVFNSPVYAFQTGLPEDLNEGFVATQDPEILEASAFKKGDDPYWWVTYKAKANALVLRRAWTRWKEDETTRGTKIVEFPLIEDLPAVYQDQRTEFRHPRWRRCTDAEFSSVADFSFFYDPFRCLDLGRGPIAKKARFSFSSVEEADGKTSLASARFPRQEILSDNGNGALVSLYVSLQEEGVVPGEGAPEQGTGAQDNVKIKSFSAKEVSAAFVSLLLADYGFSEVASESDLRKILGRDFRRLKIKFDTARTFVRINKKQKFLLRLGVSGTESDLTSFEAEAWKHGDVLYLGHQPSPEIYRHRRPLVLPEKVSDRFQLAFVGTGASFTYDLPAILEKKSRNLNVLTYGSVGYPHATEDVLKALMDEVVAEREGNAPDEREWAEVISNLEATQLETHFAFIYGAKNGAALAEKARAQGFFPSLLLNVWIP